MTPEQKQQTKDHYFAALAYFSELREEAYGQGNTKKAEEYEAIITATGFGTDSHIGKMTTGNAYTQSPEQVEATTTMIEMYLSSL